MKRGGPGPFIVAATTSSEHMIVLDGGGEKFCWVDPADCAGGDRMAAKARAQRIVEALNKADSK